MTISQTVETEDMVARLVRALPRDHLPAVGDAEAWAAFETIAVVVDALDLESDRAATLLMEAEGRWVPYLNGLQEIHGHHGLSEEDVGGPLDFDNPRAVLIDHASDATDMIAAFANSLPAVPHDALWDLSRNLAEDALIGSRGLTSVLGTYGEWLRRFTPDIGGPALEWDTTLPDWTDPNTGISIVVLSCSAELAEESAKRGMSLHHYVEGAPYSNSCVLGDIRIVSLRKGEERLSLAVFDMRKAAFVQHRGAGGGPEPIACVHTLEAYRRTPEFKRAAHRGAPRGVLPDGPIEFSVEAWRPFLTPEWRDAPTTAFFEALDLVAPATAPGMP